MRFLLGISTFCVQLIISSVGFSQSGISFLENKALDDVLVQAQKEDKKVFIDTYTKWCLPCKNLDIVFTDKALGEYFNQNFINVKFDMDNDLGKDIHLKYDVVFVPTMLVLDKNGYTILKFESSNISPSNLLEIAKRINEPSAPAVVSSQKTQLDKKPKLKQEANLTPVSSDEERVLYVLGNHTGATPELLKQEAYFRLQLMDGSHLPLVDKYLDAQKNWLDPDVMRFVYDFLYDTDSRGFSFFSNNKTRFENLFGTESVHRTLSILIEKKLTLAIPRPDFNEAQRLYLILDPNQAERLAKKYMLNRVYVEKSRAEYLRNSRVYLSSYTGTDAHEINRHALTIIHGENPEQLDYAESLLKEALNLEGPKKQYFKSLSQLYLKKGDKEKARFYKGKAINPNDT